MAIPGPTSTVGDGVASPYPLPISVSGLTGTVTDVNLVLPGLTHSGPGDLDVLLVGPGGGKAPRDVRLVRHDRRRPGSP